VLTVVYEDARTPVVDLAVYEGPAALHGMNPLSVAVTGTRGAPVEIGLAAWDGDPGLPGDALLLGDATLVDNVGRGTAAGAIECLGLPIPCRWNTLGVDIATARSPLAGPVAAVTVRAGLDPLDVGVLAVAVPSPPS
jgi:hypothetical protein